MPATPTRLGRRRLGRARLGAASPLVVPATFEEDLAGWLSGTLGLVAYPGHVPEGQSLPALTFALIRSDRPAQLGGSSGLAEARVQVGAWSPDYLDVARASESLRRGLHGRRVQMGHTPVNVALLINQVASYQPGVNADDLGTHGKVSEFVVHYRESIPNLRG